MGGASHFSHRLRRLLARARPHTPERNEEGAAGWTEERRPERRRDDRRQHHEGSGRGERLACEERAARVDQRGLATAHRTTSARATARLLLQRACEPAGDVTERGLQDGLGGVCFAVRVHVWVDPFTLRSTLIFRSCSIISVV